MELQKHNKNKLFYQMGCPAAGRWPVCEFKLYLNQMIFRIYDFVIFFPLDFFFGLFADV